MKIIDAHMHLYIGNEYFNNIAVEAGHENSAEHLERAYLDAGYVSGVVMGNGGLDPERHRYPPFLRYCIGVNTEELQSERLNESLAAIRCNLLRAQCVGIKLYPGYDRVYVYDDIYRPIYALAEEFQKPVAMHTGLTARAAAYLKYCHPLTVDELAVQYPDIKFILCHFGNPWIADACAVAMKNKNVAIDLSGLLEGRLDIPRFMREHEGYVGHLRMWLQYLGRYEDVMFGTDWPLVHLGEYAEFVKDIIPAEHHEHVFFSNANRIYRMGL